MKNIHILPTDKPSRLLQKVSGLQLHQIPFEDVNKIGCNRHIYITSDEEIKGEDWYIHKQINYLRVSNSTAILMDAKKIILTTDQDLIKDNVQSIDGEFLEWFVKNPSCEEVEVIKIDVEQPKPLYPNGNHKGERVWIEQYKIIIPQEEPKQIKCYCGHTITCDCSPLEEPKQETLEQASWRFNPLKKLDGEFLRAAFMKGAEWQAERMYSEVFEWLSERDYLTDKVDIIRKEFEQFKNK